MKIAKEIADEAITRMAREGMPPILSMLESLESIIAAKLEPVRDILDRILETELPLVMSNDIDVAHVEVSLEAALALFEEE